ncbi:MAG: DMT family transporter [Desulfofustis sp.]|nr:DMT family transporter [Desulfofustis sp.]
MTYLLLVTTTFLWGGTFIAGRLIAGDIPPFSASFLRFAIATLAMVPILAVTEGIPNLPNRRQIGPIILLGLTGIFSYNAFFFTGLSRISASRAALIIATTPLCIMLVSTLLYHEPLSRLRAIGILLSLTGALLVISNGHPALLISGGFGVGELALLGCVVSWTAYTFIGKRVLTTMQPLPCVFYAILAGTLLLAIPALAEGLPALLPAIDTLGWASLAYLGIGGTSLGFSWYYLGIKRIGPSRAGVFINLVPVFALLQSWLLLSETLKPIVLAGGILVCLGVYLANRPSSLR